MLKAIIFDLDGVLIDSLEFIITTFNELLKEHGASLDRESFRKINGMSLRDQIEIWKKEFNITSEGYWKEFPTRSSSIQLRLMRENIKPNPVINHFIGSAKKKGYKIAVATSSRKYRAGKILELLGIRDKLDALVTAEDVERHKPDPQAFLKAAEELGISPEECIVFEDAVNGIEAARNAGMRSVAFLTNFNEKRDFEDIADLIINDFSEIDIGKLEGL